MLDSEKLKAQNEIIYQVVTVQSHVPSDALITAATRVCVLKNASQPRCMKDFIDRYGDVWVVNLIEGSRVLLAYETRDGADR